VSARQAKYSGPFYKLSTARQRVPSKTVLRVDNTSFDMLQALRSRLHIGVHDDIESVLESITLLGTTRGKEYDDIPWCSDISVVSSALFGALSRFSHLLAACDANITWNSTDTPDVSFMTVMPRTVLRCGTVVSREIYYNGYVFEKKRFVFDAALVPRNIHVFLSEHMPYSMIVSDDVRRTIEEFDAKYCGFHDPSDLEVLW
jgi:hypothetical protein